MLPTFFISVQASSSQSYLYSAFGRSLLPTLMLDIRCWVTLPSAGCSIDIQMKWFTSGVQIAQFVRSARSGLSSKLFTQSNNRLRPMGNMQHLYNHQPLMPHYWVPAARCPLCNLPNILFLEYCASRTRC